MFKRSLLATLSLSLIVSPVGVLAQDRDGTRAMAKRTAAELRGFGEPKDRCAIGAFVVDGGVVTRTVAGSKLAPGDQVLALNGQDVRGRTAQEDIAVLRAVAADATVSVKINRAGADMTLDVACSNARPATEALLRGLDFAADGKFDDCAAALDQHEELGTGGALIRAQCLAVSKKASEYNQAQAAYDMLRLQLEDARWNEASRAKGVEALHRVEGLITRELDASKFQELVAITRKWPGGQTMYADSAPDWSLFRRNSETALRGRLIDPDSARIEWTYGFTYGDWKPMLSRPIEGYWTCGSINARNRMGGYTGATSFVVVVDSNGSVEYVEMGEARDFDFLTLQCNKSAHLLPPPQAELAAISASGAAAGAGSSLADELKKLSDLRTAGALTEEEFEAAKKRLLAQ